MEAMDLIADIPESLAVPDTRPSFVQSGTGAAVPPSLPRLSKKQPGSFHQETRGPIRDEQRASASVCPNVPTAALLKHMDQLYRQKAGQDTLPKIAPKQLNRAGIAWLPVMQVTLEGWHFTVKFSNTLRANRLGKTSDWVIVNYRSNAGRTGHVTIVTETHGPEEGQRVLRGYTEKAA